MYVSGQLIIADGLVARKRGSDHMICLVRVGEWTLQFSNIVRGIFKGEKIKAVKRREKIA